MRLRRPVPALLAAALLGGLVPLAAATPVAAATSYSSNADLDSVATGQQGGSRCSPDSGRTFSGTITGADGLGVNTTIGFDMKDSRGTNIDMFGCPLYGYSAVVQTNHWVGGRGAPLGSMQYNRATTYQPSVGQGPVTSTWRLEHLPVNAVGLWIESYSRSYTGSPCGLRCAGSLDVSKYGMVNRRAVPLSQGGVDLVLPLTRAYGGNTGSLSLTVRDKAGRAVQPGKVYAWSMAPDGKPRSQGWGIGVSRGNGRVDVPALASGQDYVVWVYVGDRVAARRYHLAVGPNATRRLTVTL